MNIKKNGFKKVVLGSVLSLVMHSALGAGPDSRDGDWKRDHNKRHSNYQMHEYKPTATPANIFNDYAKVVSVTPVIVRTRIDSPHQYCWDEATHQRTYRKSYTPIIVGGILGGVIGNQVGGGTGNDLMTVGGVILGASIGHDIAGRSAEYGYHTTGQKHCESIHDYHHEERVEGYDVRYVYNGRSFVRRMDHPPGRKVRVR